MVLYNKIRTALLATICVFVAVCGSPVKASPIDFVVKQGQSQIANMAPSITNQAVPIYNKLQGSAGNISGALSGAVGSGGLSGALDNVTSKAPLYVPSVGNITSSLPSMSGLPSVSGLKSGLTGNVKTAIFNSTGSMGSTLYNSLPGSGDVSSALGSDYFDQLVEMNKAAEGAIAEAQNAVLYAQAEALAVANEARAEAERRVKEAYEATYQEAMDKGKQIVQGISGSLPVDVSAAISDGIPKTGDIPPEFFDLNNLPTPKLDLAVLTNLQGAAKDYATKAAKGVLNNEKDKL